MLFNHNRTYFLVFNYYSQSLALCKSKVLYPSAPVINFLSELKAAIESNNGYVNISKFTKV